MKISDLKGKIFFEKDKEGDLSQLLYGPILDILNSQTKEDFGRAIAVFLFLMTWDNIVICKKLRSRIILYLSDIVFNHEEEEWSRISSSFFNAVIFSSAAENPFGIKDFIDYQNNKNLSWKDIFKEVGLEFY
jgi:hypothetical protein